jgi:hypothetical protein
MTLNAIRNQGGEARIPEITSISDELYNQIENDHLRRMIGAELVEKIDEGERSAGGHSPKKDANIGSLISRQGGESTRGSTNELRPHPDRRE